MLAFVVMKQCFAWAAAGFSLGYVPMEKAQWRTFPPALPLPLPEMAFLLSASVYGAFQEERFCGLAVIRKDEHGWGRSSICAWTLPAVGRELPQRCWPPARALPGGVRWRGCALP